MECPECGYDTKVVESGGEERRRFVFPQDLELLGGADFIKRRRECKKCKHRLFTFEITKDKLEALVNNT